MHLKHYAKTKLPTKFGKYDFHVFRDDADQEISVLTLGDSFDQREAVFTRIHSECVTSEIFGSLKCDCSLQLEAALSRIQELGCGVLIYLNQEGRGIGLGNKIKAYALQEEGLDTVEANEQLGFAVDLRKYDAAVAVLKFFKVQAVRLNSNNPKKIQVLKDAGFSVEREVLKVDLYDESLNYVQTKIKKCGHLS